MGRYPVTDAFDSDVLISAARDEESAAPVRELFATTDQAGVGSLVLLPEVLSKPLRIGDRAESAALRDLLERLDLRPADQAVADLAVKLAAKHRLKAADAIHLATAVLYGADRFITSNRRDFPTTIEEIDIVYPDTLPAG